MSESFHFLRPLWFLMLIPLSLWLFWLWRIRSRSDAWQQVCDAHLLPHLLVQFSGSRQRLALWLLAIGWLLAVLALAGPTWSKRPQPVFETEQARVLILDLSRSMDAADIKPSRLTQAKFKLRDMLQHSTEGQTALLAFAGDVHVVSPLTNDAETIASLVPALDTAIMPVPGSKPVLALQAARDLLKQGGALQGDIILITDGVEDAAATVFAEKLAQQGYRLSVLGVGTAQGAPIPTGSSGFLKDHKGAIVIPRLDAKALQKLAHAGGGLYVPYTADQRDVYYLLAPPADAEFKQTKDHQLSESWEEQGAWLLLLLVPIAALSFRRGWLLVLLPIVFILPPNAKASFWEDLWQRRDQQGQQALQAEQAAQAAQLFDTPDWQGVAHYRAGDYEAAAQSFAQVDSANGHYNRGNALAKMGDLQAALRAYTAALEKNPQHQQAQENKALIEKLLEQQKEQPKEQQQENSQQGEQGEPSEDGTANEQQQQNAQQGEDKQGEQNQSSQAEQQQAQQDQQNRSEQSAQQSSSQAGEQNQEPSAAQASQEQQQGEQPSEEEIRQALQEQEEQAESEPHSQAELSNAEEESDEHALQQAAQAQLSPEELQAQEQEIALEQWLNRVQDDPSGLLRRKFALEYRKRQLEQRRGVPQDSPEQTW